MSPVLIVILVGVLLLALSGIPKQILDDLGRRKRLREFRLRYDRWTQHDDSEREWLVANRRQAQRDTRSVGLGIIYIAPPPAVGGGPARPFEMFSDLFSETSFSETISAEYRLDALAEADAELAARIRKNRWKLLNPFAWIAGVFSTVARWPAAIVRNAGFRQAADGTAVRVASVIWQAALGVAAIVAAVFAVLTYLDS